MGLYLVDICPQRPFTVHSVNQPDFHSRQCDIRGQQVNALAVVQNTVAVGNRIVVNHRLYNVRKRNGQIIGFGIAEGERQGILRVCVDQQDPFVFLCKPDSEVGGRCGFTHAAFLVRHRNYFAIRHFWVSSFT